MISKLYGRQLGVWKTSLRLILAVLLCMPITKCSAVGQMLPEVVKDAQAKVVKVYGAGGFRALEGYQSGFFVSEDGLVLTAWSYVLDPASIRVVDHLGEKSEATLIGFDPETEVALLSTDLRPIEFFQVKQNRRLSVGRRVLAMSNLFNVAVGDEAVSVQSGVVSAVTSLRASQRTLKVPYQGPVYYIDAMSNNPGSSGGALVDHRGELAGMLGRELSDQSGDFWINYALPADIVAEALTRIENGASGKTPPANETNQPLEPMELSKLGIKLVPRLTLNTPAFVEWVEEGSVAWTSGLRPDDLILKVQAELVSGRDQVLEQVNQLDQFATLQLMVRRGAEVLELKIVP